MFLLTFIVSMACARPVHGQERAVYQPVFPTLFPNPTGRNGYEEIVLAGDLCRSSDKMNAYLNGSGIEPLSAARVAIDDQRIRRGLALLRIGLNKPRTAIYHSSEPNANSHLLLLLRHLAGVLMAEQTVLFADGKVSQAVESFRDTLRLAAAARADTFRSGQTQVGIEITANRLFGRHFGQLSARDCDRVLSLARERVSAQDPTVELLASEIGIVTGILDRARQNSDGLYELLNERMGKGGTDSSRQDALRKEFEGILAQPGAYGALFEDLKLRCASRMTAEINRLSKPIYQRDARSDSKPETLVDMLVESCLPAIDQLAERYVISFATARLLGLHAAILRFQWEFDRLPEQLEDLPVSDLLSDPFTGQPMLYRRLGTRSYELWSAGPLRRDAYGNPIPGSRARLTVPVNFSGQ